MNKQLKFSCYHKTAGEVANLRKISGVWQREPGGFWSFDRVIEALQRNSVRLFYLAPEVDNSPWQAAALVDIGPDTADLLYVYTMPEMRGAGLGRQLLTRVLEWLTGNTVDGCIGIRKDEFFLEVRISNIPAIKLYESLGMDKVQVRKRYYSDGEDAFVFKCKVDVKRNVDVKRKVDSNG